MLAIQCRREPIVGHQPLLNRIVFNAFDAGWSVAVDPIIRGTPHHIRVFGQEINLYLKFIRKLFIICVVECDQTTCRQFDASVTRRPSTLIGLLIKSNVVTVGFNDSM